ncbi:TIGR04168 family protein [Gloeocapsa sp. PCC 73106]|uniref:TIGR04168 family protein n=1 Tax=Gloeocapsa sp. PCC 73106 TaxID=102232 RepID=UPI0002AC41D2|nr:TIGR04168 family protein [Gloeocapsa sp. PCC 73106]ELR96395.1 Calcineurin-like phosphoesterase [Gloeocapsa sp. PCC 73106]
MSNQAKKPIKIVVVGDVHEQWETEDEIALDYLGADLVLFVGDFGNESVNLVAKIARINLPKAVILGNHDAWYSASDWGRKKSPYDHSIEDRVQQQLDLLGSNHVGYAKIDFPELNLTVVGSRPFSWGGPTWKNDEFYRDRYHVNNFRESTQRIVTTAQQTPRDNLIILAHNGPFGLGDTPEAACGRDWNPLGGDFGDPDLTEAIEQINASSKRILLVAFGHMHHQLRHTKSVLRQAINKSPEGTLYFNAASVPRIKITSEGKLRNFSIVYLENSQVTKISLIWLGENYDQVSEQIFYSVEESSLLRNG